MNQIIIKIDDKDYKINSLLSQKLITTKKYAEEVDLAAKRLFQTFYSNLFIKQELNSLIYKTISSTKINPKKLSKVKQKISEEIKKTEMKLNKIIIENESDVKDHTYNEFGIAYFQFEDS